MFIIVQVTSDGLRAVSTGVCGKVLKVSTLIIDSITVIISACMCICMCPESLVATSFDLFSVEILVSELEYSTAAFTYERSLSE